MVELKYCQTRRQRASCNFTLSWFWWNTCSHLWKFATWRLIRRGLTGVRIFFIKSKSDLSNVADSVKALSLSHALTTLNCYTGISLPGSFIWPLDLALLSFQQVKNTVWLLFPWVLHLWIWLIAYEKYLKKNSRKFLKRRTWICHAQATIYIAFILYYNKQWGFPGGLDGKESPIMRVTQGSIPGSGRPREGNDYPLHYSCLENSYY